MKLFLFLLLLISGSVAHGQPVAEKKAILDLCGCFSVSFKYAETFAPDSNYHFEPRYEAAGIEWVTPLDSAGGTVSIQHILIIEDNFFIKHWREDWEYQKSDWWMFDHDGRWKHSTASQPATGEWTQTVWEVDDGPRYQGSSKWISNNQKYYWENTTDAPLPRREYTQRKDYNVLNRSNRIIITGNGWTHEQDNRKMIRSTGKRDSLLAEEKGYNIYTRTEDPLCARAAAWWKNHAAFWMVVRQVWKNTLRQSGDLFQLKTTVDGERLYEKLDEVENGKIAPDKLAGAVADVLKKYTER